MLTFNYFLKLKQRYVKKSRNHNFFGLRANKLCTYLQQKKIKIEKIYVKKFQHPTNQGSFWPMGY